MQTIYNNANSAFIDMYESIVKDGIENSSTKSLYNVGFYIQNPKDRKITAEWRKWSQKYAEREWAWYLSNDRSVENIKKYAPTWDKMHSGDNIVNSNYGWQWNRMEQLQKCIEQLMQNHETRQACITIYDGKEKYMYKYDTPCTLNICFTIVDNKLCMTVNMRSNDLIYGFCNDQYCFSMLQEVVAKQLRLEIGWYYHFVINMHIYKNFYNLKENYYVKQNRS